MSEPVRKPEWIARKLEAAAIVEWDRFVIEDHDGDQCVKIYGWIDRDDEYMDFVIASFWPDGKYIGFTTSSDEWSEWLHEEWLGGDPIDHNPCRRVENAFDVENAVRLAEPATLGEFAEKSEGESK